MVEKGLMAGVMVAMLDSDPVPEAVLRARGVACPMGLVRTSEDEAVGAAAAATDDGVMAANISFGKKRNFEKNSFK